MTPADRTRIVDKAAELDDWLSSHDNAGLRDFVQRTYPRHCWLAVLLLRGEAAPTPGSEELLDSVLALKDAEAAYNLREDVDPADPTRRVYRIVR